VKAFCKRWRAPRAYTELALITTEFHTLVHRALELKPSTLLKLLIRTDSLRKPERFQKMLDACLADIRGRKGFADAAYPQADFLARLAVELRQLDLTEILQQGLTGKALGRAIQAARLDLIKREKALALPQQG
jgi:tRNA nucleotidyltransferase (CCA-adding enzyme)